MFSTCQSHFLGNQSIRGLYACLGFIYFGTTLEEAKKNFTEAVEIFFDEIVKMGTLEDVLLDLGWKKQNKDFIPPVVISQGMESVRVPFAPPNNQWPDLLQYHGRNLRNFFCFGVQIQASKGSHRVYTRSGLKRPLVVPAYGEIPIFIIRNNLRLLNMSVEEYLEISKQL